MGSVISGISLVCFAASYAVAWAMELTNVWAPRRVPRLLTVVFVVAGFLAHTLYLGYRVVEFSASPLSSSFDWCLVAAWLLIVAYFYLAWYHPRAGLGVYMLPLALALVAAASLADRRPFEAEPASQVWGAVHGIALLLGTLAVMMGFTAGLMYLVQADRLKRKRAPLAGFKLPSLEWLERINSRVIVVSALLVGVGFLSGMILNSIGHEGEIPWTDPVIWTSALMFGWLLAAAVFNGVYRPARRGRKVAYLTVVSFVFLVVVLCVLLLVDTQHGGQKRRIEAKVAPPSSRVLAEGRS